MRNYNTYLKGMEKGNDEKLFFTSILQPKDFNRIIDFGCGRGDILKACSRACCELVGIDHDPIMLQYAKENVPNAVFYSSLTRGMITNRTLIIFSSVLHEVEDYWTELKAIIQGTGATVVVRDMRFSGAEELLDKSIMSQVVRNSHPHMLGDFINRWGFKTDKDLYHWLLKYSYVDNWKLENKENYFSFNYKNLFELGEVIYERNYTLEFKKQKVLEDFGIELTKPTHTQLIIKLKETL